MNQVYLIEEEVFFSPGESPPTLVHISAKEDVVRLPIPAAGILRILLEAEGQPVSREFLMVEVWEKNGRRGSYNNLGLNIAKLRSSFAKVGYDPELILTEAGYGYSIQAQWRNLETPKKNIPAEIIKNINARKTKTFIGISLCIIIFVSCLLFFTYRGQSNEIKGSYFSGYSKTCPIYTFDKIPPEKRNTFLESFNKRVPADLHQCGKNEVLFTFLPGTFYHAPGENLKEYFVARCLVQEKMLIGCENYYFKEE